MHVAAHDIRDWIADRQALLIAAWTPDIAGILSWDEVVAEVLVGELHMAMATTFLRGGTEQNYLNLVARRGSGLPSTTERQIAQRFFAGTLKLARAASRHIDQMASYRVMPFKRGVVVTDGRTDPNHLPLGRVLLPADHEFWSRWHPPFGLECRCSTLGMTDRMIKQEGLSITTPLDLASIETRLRDDWSIAFQPLLDFRRPVEIIEERRSELKISKDEYAEIMRLFDNPN